MKFGKISLLLVLLISFLFIQQSSSNLWPWMGGDEEEGNPSEGQEGGEHEGQEGGEEGHEGHDHGQEGASGSGENPGQSVEGITELTDENFDKFLVGKKAVLVGKKN
jgi:hypothetical protein